VWFPFLLGEKLEVAFFDILLLGGIVRIVEAQKVEQVFHRLHWYSATLQQQCNRYSWIQRCDHSLTRTPSHYTEEQTKTNGVLELKGLNAGNVWEWWHLHSYSLTSHFISWNGIRGHTKHLLYVRCRCRTQTKDGWRDDSSHLLNSHDDAAQHWATLFIVSSSTQCDVMWCDMILARDQWWSLMRGMYLSTHTCTVDVQCTRPT